VNGGTTSSQERSDDPRGPGYGSTKQDANIDKAEDAETVDSHDRNDAVPNNKKRKEDADGDWPEWSG
jgi:hypothetical protein